MATKTKCKVLKAFPPHEVDDIIECTDAEVAKWTRRGRIKVINRRKADRRKVGPAPPSPIERKTTGPSETSPGGPAETPKDKPNESGDPGPSQAPATAPDVTKTHRGGGKYWILVDGQPIRDAEGIEKLFEKEAANDKVAELEKLAAEHS